MEEEQKTTEHKRDIHGNVVMPATTNGSGHNWMKHAVISGAFALLLLITTCMFGISLTQSRAMNETLTHELNNIGGKQSINKSTTPPEEEELHNDTQKSDIWGYYFEYRF